MSDETTNKEEEARCAVELRRAAGRLRRWADIVARGRATIHEASAISAELATVYEWCRGLDKAWGLTFINIPNEHRQEWGAVFDRLSVPRDCPREIILRAFANMGPLDTIGDASIVIRAEYEEWVADRKHKEVM